MYYIKDLMSAINVNQALARLDALDSSLVQFQEQNAPKRKRGRPRKPLQGPRQLVPRKSRPGRKLKHVKEVPVPPKRRGRPRKPLQGPRQLVPRKSRPGRKLKHVKEVPVPPKRRGRPRKPLQGPRQLVPRKSRPGRKLKHVKPVKVPRGPRVVGPKVVELRARLRARGLKVSGNKAQLMARLGL